MAIAETVMAAAQTVGWSSRARDTIFYSIRIECELSYFGDLIRRYATAAIRNHTNASPFTVEVVHGLSKTSHPKGWTQTSVD